MLPISSNIASLWSRRIFKLLQGGVIPIIYTNFIQNLFIVVKFAFKAETDKVSFINVTKLTSVFKLYIEYCISNHNSVMKNSKNYNILFIA